LHKPSDKTPQSPKGSSTNRLPVNLETMFDHATAMIDVWDYETYQYVFVSNAVAYVTGHTPEDWIKLGVRNIQSIIHPEDRDQVIYESEKNRQAAAELGPGVDDSKPFSTVEFRLLRKGGGYVWLHSDSSVYSRTPDGRMKYVVSTSVNIDAQKAYEAQLMESARRLEESRARLRQEYEQLQLIDNAKDDFVSIASHQLRTPATGVGQYIGLLLQDYVGPLSEEQRQLLQAASELNDRQIRIVDDLLSAAQAAGMVQVHATATRLDTLAADVAEEQGIKGRARHQDISFRREGPGPFDVSVDAFLIRMVLENLIDNARKYSPDGSSIEVCVSSDKSWVTVEVMDHGFGIAKQDRDKLFKKFSRVQTDKTKQIAGTGLGLYWAKQVVELHGGDLRLVKSSRSGSSFACTLPLASSHAQ